jgi:hypothetical protein
MRAKYAGYHLATRDVDGRVIKTWILGNTFSRYEVDEIAQNRI